jgi:hypothetical protein
MSRGATLPSSFDAGAVALTLSRLGGKAREEAYGGWAATP